MKKFYIFLCFFIVIFEGHSQERVSTAATNVSIIQKEFVIPQLNTKPYKVWVYLPPNYQTSTKKYPVIYMHDGQNLFDDKTSFIGEWNVDETLNELYKNTGKGFIVVGIENGGEERINEYTPWPHEEYGGGKGSIYIDFIVNTLKPFIDTTYRTKPQQKYTGLIGSSLGGLISYYGGLKYPSVFGKIGALSTSFWFSSEVFAFTKHYGKLNTVKMYLLVGGKEGEGIMEADTKTIEKLLLESGFNNKNLITKISPEGDHNEAFWRSEFQEVVSRLFNLK